MKTIASLALMGLVYGSEDNELFRPTTFRPVHVPHHKFNATATEHTNNQNLHHNNHAEAHTIPHHLHEKNSQVYATAHLDDEELFSLGDLPENELASFFGKVGTLVKSKIVPRNSTKKRATNSFDDEFFPIRIKNNTYPIYYEDEELFNANAQRIENSHHIEKGINKKVNSIIEDETVAELEELIKAGASIYNEVKTKQYVNALNHEVQELKKMLNDENAYFTFEEINDDDLFQFCINYRGGKICHNR